MWKYVASAQILTMMERLSPKQRHALRLALDRMAEHPPLDAPIAFVDLTGRTQQSWIDGDF